MTQIDALLDKIETLPASPSLLPKLLPKLSDVDEHFDEVVEIISLDPALTVQLLRISNSAFFGQSEPILNVQDAVTRVGYQSVYLLTAMIDGSNAFPQMATGTVDTGRLWAHSVTAAFSTKYVAESTGQDTNLLFTAGLLHDVGKIVLAQIQPDALNATIYNLSEAEVLEQERKLFGCTHAEVGSALMKRWGLPEQVIAAVDQQHAARAEGAAVNPLGACLELGNLFSHGQADRRVLASPQFMSGLSSLDLGPTAMQGWMKKLQANQQIIDGMSQLANVRRSASVKKN